MHLLKYDLDLSARLNITKTCVSLMLIKHFKENPKPIVVLKKNGQITLCPPQKNQALLHQVKNMLLGLDDLFNFNCPDAYVYGALALTKIHLGEELEFVEPFLTKYYTKNKEVQQDSKTLLSLLVNYESLLKRESLFGIPTLDNWTGMLGIGASHDGHSLEYSGRLQLLYLRTLSIIAFDSKNKDASLLIQALGHMDELLDVYNKYDRFYQIRGRIYYTLGRFQEAEVDFFEVYKRNPKDPRRIHDLWTIDMRTGQFKEAMALFNTLFLRIA